MNASTRRFPKLILLLAIVALLSAGVPVYAAAPSTGASHAAALVLRLAAAGRQAGQVWLNLTPGEQQEVITDLTPTQVEVSVTNGPSGASPQACRWAQVEVYYTNIFHQKLVAYFQKINWCYNGSTVTSHTRIRWGETYALFWQFKGNIGSRESGGNGHTYYEAWTQGEFALCLPYVGCGQYKYPWIDMTVRGNGSWSYTYGG